MQLPDRLRIEASPRGVTRVTLARGRSPRKRWEAPAGHHAARARREVAQYLAGQRRRFSVPVDLGALPSFQAKVLVTVRRIPFGQVISYATLAARVGHPAAARAVGNALAANPAPLLVPCHRVVRRDGTWGRYALGARVKTALLRLERGRLAAALGHGQAPRVVGSRS